jgi:hypothetical protein
MGLFSKDIQTMDDLFLHTLQDIYLRRKQDREVVAGHDRQRRQ